MKRYLFTSLLVVLVITAAQARQQNNQQIHKENKPTQETNRIESLFADSPFNITVDKLPANYQGHDIVAVYNQVEEAVPAKNEYESTEQYKARLNSIVMNDVYAFRVEQSRAVDFFYDADTQAMKLTMKTRPVRVIDFSIKYDTPRMPAMATGITINSGRAITSSYTGQNAYGATKEVTKSLGVDFGIAIEKLPETMTGKSLLAAYGMSDIGLSFAIAPERARDLKTKLGVLFICKLKSPFRIVFDRSVTSPTFSDPVDALTLHNTLFTELKGIWIYNTESGEVIKKFNIEK